MSPSRDSSSYRRGLEDGLNLAAKLAGHSDSAGSVGRDLQAAKSLAKSLARKVPDNRIVAEVERHLAGNLSRAGDA